MKKLLCVLAALALMLTLAACAQRSILEEDNVLFSFGDGKYEVNRDFFNYQMLYSKNYYDKGDNTFWLQNPTAGAQVVASAVGYYQQRYAMLEWADSLGVGESDADAAAVEAKIQEYITGYGSQEAFHEALSESMLTEAVLRRFSAEDLVIERLGDLLYAENSQYATVTADDLAAFRAAPTLYKAKHILVKNDTDDDKAANLARAQALLEQLRAGADFDTLMLANTEDPGVQSYPDGYVFGDGEMVEEFENGVKALGMGEISEVIESTHGYHIILRLELSDQEITDTIVDNKISAELERRNSEAFETIKYTDGFLELAIIDFVWPYTEEN